MKCNFIRWLLVFLYSSPIFSGELSLNRRQVYVGPDWYHVSRTKKGGAKQSGNLFGIRLGYDRFKRYGWYFGEEIRYAKGTLKGHLATGEKLNSQLTDCLVEGRLGYTFQQKRGIQLSFTPFLGIGYFNEQNNFSNSSLIPIHCRTHFTYGALGFFSWAHYCNFELGLNFTARLPYEPKCRVSNDPNHDSVTQNIKQQVQYRVELPLSYRPSDCFIGRYLRCGEGVISLVPYYEYRHYGAHPNYPFNFIKTEFQIWGATLEFIYRM